jgi:hypothetical protein
MYMFGVGVGAGGVGVGNKSAKNGVLVVVID